MRIDRKNLLTKLEQVKWGLDSRGTVEQSASYVFKDNKIFTFNDEVYCQVDYESDIEGAVHAHQLLTLLGKLSEDEIDIAVNGEELLIKGKNKRAGIRTDNEIVLPIDDVEVPEEWKVLDPEFNDAVEIVQSCASKDESNFSLTCIHIHPDYLEACDNFQLVRYPLKTGVSDECLVKRESVKEITGLGMSEIAEGKSWIHFRSGDGLQLSCRKWSDEYTELSQILECDGTKLTLPTGMTDGIETTEIFVEEGQISVSIKQGTLKFKGLGAHGWYEERRKVEYSGEPVSFQISPRLLVDITKRTNECELAPGRLKIDAEKFVFIACLGVDE